MHSCIVGAGLLGFLINPPLSLYYMQGLNLTPLHGHTALFGVYGMLGIGLALMALLTLLPLGTMQLLAALRHGYWYARSAEFMQQPIVDTLVWLRVPGDVVFSIGALSLTWFFIRLWLWPKRETVSE
ncbi:MAG TPA: hypothetical protein VFS17_02300 [Methylophilaceae bacterium]|nr:hypothetical protein [Methylophilaceae bacterium]